MAASATLPAKLPALPAERFFHASMFFLILTALGTLVSTGKLDLPTCVLAPLAMIYKGIRLWRGQPPELSHTRATWLVICYLGFSPCWPSPPCWLLPSSRWTLRFSFSSSSSCSSVSALSSDSKCAVARTERSHLRSAGSLRRSAA